MRFATITGSLLLLLSASTEAGSVSPESVLRRTREFRPTTEELRWQQIPWMTSLDEAKATAKKERRPLLVWGSNDDPLDRC